MSHIQISELTQTVIDTKEDGLGNPTVNGQSLVSTIAGTRSWASLDAPLTADKTVVIPTGSTKAEVQALIDAEGKNLGGHTLTFEFEDGTYTGSYVFGGFYAGTLFVKGETYSTTSNTTQSVILNGTAETTDTLLFTGDLCGIKVEGLRVRHNSTGGYCGIWLKGCPAFSIIRYNSYQGIGTSGGYSFFTDSGSALVGDSKVDNTKYGIVINYTNAKLYNCQWTGTQPTIGASFSAGSVVSYNTTTNTLGTVNVVGSVKVDV